MNYISDKVKDKIKTNILYSVIFFSKIVPVMVVTDDKMTHALCILDT